MSSFLPIYNIEQEHYAFSTTGELISTMVLGNV